MRGRVKSAGYSKAIDKSKTVFLLVFDVYETIHKQRPQSCKMDVIFFRPGNRIDSAIAAEYNKAPEGVSDRVRKRFSGYSNIWLAVARAWFQDALLRTKTIQVEPLTGWPLWVYD